MDCRRDSGPGGRGSRGAAAGLALRVSDCRGAGQSDGLAPGREPVVLFGQAAALKLQSNGGDDSKLNRRWCSKRFARYAVLN